MTTPADFEIPPLQLRRGTDTAIMAYEAAAGEPIWTVDTQEFRIGDGSTPGGILINGSGPTGATGYTGSRGATGQSSNYYRYKAKTGTTSGNPGSGFLIWNNATQISATQINLSHLDNDGNDIDVFLALLNTGDTVIVQDQSNSDNYQVWNVSSTATVFSNSYVEVPVTLTSSTGTGATGFANNHELLFIIQSAGVQGPIGYTGSKGDVGYTGSRGYTGSQGDAGYVGSQGNFGYTGSQGATGPEGPGFSSTGTATVAELTVTNILTAGGGIFDNITVNYTATIKDINQTNDWLALGKNAYTPKSGAYVGHIAIGYAASASGTQGSPLAIGSQAVASGNNSLALGAGATGSGDYSVAIGQVANATNIYAQALGRNSSASGAYSMAVGIANASGDYSAAIGYSASSSGENSIALGKSAVSSNSYATALGASTKATGLYSTALGTTAVANNTDNIAIGHLAGSSSGFTITNAINSIIINGSGSELTAANSGLYVAPVRSSTSTQVLFYDATTKEITYGASSSIGSAYDQNLNTTDNVVFKSVKSTQVLSAGGYPLDSNGQALLLNANTQSLSMVVSNYTAGLVPGVQVRGYGQNRPGTVTTATGGGSSLLLESSRGTPSSQLRSGTGDTIGAVLMGGYDGSRWSSDAGASVQFVATALENFIGDATTATNIGARWFIRSQPMGVQLSATSRHFDILTSQTAGSSSAPPTHSLLLGQAGNDFTTLTMANGVDIHQGHGATTVLSVNAKHQIIGVPFEDAAVFTASISGTTMDVTAVSSGILSIGQRVYATGVTSGTFITALGTATGGTGTYTVGTSQTVSSMTMNSGADNTTLNDSITLTFVSGRKNGVGGRRNALRANDAVGRISFNGQTANSQSGTGSRVSNIRVEALENYSGSARGSKMIFTTVNTGTTTEATRLSLKDKENNYNSDLHTFSNAAASSSIATFSTASIVLAATNVGFATDGFIINNAANTQSIISAQDQNIVLGRNGANNLATFTTSGISFNNGSGVAIANFTTASITVAAPIDVTGLSRSTGNVVSGMNAGSTTYDLFTFSQTEYSGGKFVIKINDNADRHMVEMMVTGDGTNVVYNEYAVLTNNGDLGTFDAVASGGNIVVRFTTKAGISNANAKVSATLLA